jgi:hypothetical protein
MTQQADIVPGRTCRGCTLCCKLLSIEELEKPPLTWCAICDAKAGCRDYEHRPTECRNFYCGYLLDPALDERWKPSSCKLVVAFEEHAKGVVIHVDPTRHDAWRKEPFHSQIRQWALAAAPEQGQAVVWQGNTKIVVPAEAPGDPVEVGPDQPEFSHANEVGPIAAGLRHDGVTPRFGGSGR